MVLTSHNCMPCLEFTTRSIHWHTFFNPTDTIDLRPNLASTNYELPNRIPAVVKYFGGKVQPRWAEIAEYEERLQKILLNCFFTVAGVGESTVGGGGGEIDDRCMDCRSGHMYSHRLLKEVEAVKDESGEGIILAAGVDVEGLVGVLQV
ncbi:Pyridoxal phosphate-dependent transferase major region subdomain 2 [Penicillium hetheringtonii]|uniref:Pyridoxal phosphate-dependent transferase major region subdomain 2 n=1 Tax=Penicillium hetheringtonii TaxID=911720 RepID=A0AAD6E3T1_9EURO|nr:Pyridoxal phosphate-dependent transferase major region subdomain 2 [Penicillium hetheringtonii]